MTEGEFHPQPTLKESSVTSPDSTPKASPLAAIHEAAGATFTDFAGWMMPVRYSSDLAEHHAVRTAAGIFDISHMAEITVEGPEAGAFLDFALAGRLSTITVGQAKYSLLLEHTGGIIDDLIVYRLGDDLFFVVANAGNRHPVVSALTGRAEDFDVRVTDVSDEYALIAVQGPASQQILEATPSIDGLTVPLDELAYYRSTDAHFDSLPLLIARTGYTGENGYELYVQADAATALWAALTTAGEDFGLVPAGLASRDTLRLEAGMPLYGHELSLDIQPVQAGLGRVPVMAKDFIGHAALEKGVSEDARVLVGLVAEGRRAARAGYAVVVPDTGEEVGNVTSGALSPTLGHPIAMAFVDPAYAAIGTTLDLDVRGSRMPATVTALPFYRREKN